MFHLQPLHLMKTYDRRTWEAWKSCLRIWWEPSFVKCFWDSHHSLFGRKLVEYNHCSVTKVHIITQLHPASFEYAVAAAWRVKKQLCHSEIQASKNQPGYGLRTIDFSLTDHRPLDIISTLLHTIISPGITCLDNQLCSKLTTNTNT